MNADTRHFYVPLCQISGSRLKISGRELHHLSDVVRLREGDLITVLDGSGGIYDVALISCGKEAAIGEIRNRTQIQPPLVEVTLLVGLLKADRMDLIVQKAAELGAHSVVPLMCQHTVPSLSVRRAAQRVARWRQITIEASKQSHQPFFPVVSDVLCFNKAIEESQADLKLIFVARELSGTHPQSFTDPSRLRSTLRQHSGHRKVDIFIGPEGGFAENEILLALSAGVVPASLGSNILRTETAAIVALAIVLYEKASLTVAGET